MSVIVTRYTVMGHASKGNATKNVSLTTRRQKRVKRTYHRKTQPPIGLKPS